MSCYFNTTGLNDINANDILCDNIKTTVIRTEQLVASNILTSNIITNQIIASNIIASNITTYELISSNIVSSNIFTSYLFASNISLNGCNLNDLFFSTDSPDSLFNLNTSFNTAISITVPALIDEKIAGSLVVYTDTVLLPNVTAREYAFYKEPPLELITYFGATNPTLRLNYNDNQFKITDNKLTIIPRDINYWSNIGNIIWSHSNIGIGTENPDSKLHVIGDITNVGNIYGNNIQVGQVISTEKIGIGTITPSQALDIVGNMKLSYSGRGGISVYYSDVPSQSGYILFENSSGQPLGNIGFRGNMPYQSYLSLSTNSIFGCPGWFLVGNLLQDPAVSYTNSFSGNLGINKTAPSQALDVVGNILSSGSITAASLNLSSGTITSGIITTNNIINLNRNTGANPSVGITGGTGDRVILYQGTGSVHPYAFGIGSGTLWYSVPIGGKHSFYVNGTEYLTLNSTTFTSTNVINLNRGTTGSPSTNTTGGSGDRIILWQGGTGVYPYSIGVSTNSVWFNVPTAIKYNFNINNTEIINIKGSSVIINADISSRAFNVLSVDQNFGIGIGTNIIENVGISSQDLTLSVLGTGNLYLKTNNNNRFVINSSGNVGIGSMTPTEILDVIGNIKSTGSITSSSLTLTSGAITTNNLINLNRNTSTAPATGSTGSTGDRVILYQGGVGVHPYSLGIGTGTLWYSVPNGAKHSFYINGTEYITINSGGSLNVVSNDTYIGSFKHTNLTQGLGITYNSIDAIGSGATQDISLNAKSTGSIYFNTNNATRIAIRGDGNVGIGSASPTQKLDVNGSAVVNGTLTTNYLTVNANTGNTGNLEYISYIANTGGVLGTPAGQFYSSSSICAVFNSATWFKGTIFVSSDERIKKDIDDLDNNDALNKLLLLKPKIFKYKDFINHNSSNIYGFVAQDIKKILPEAIKIQKDFIPNIYEKCYCNSNIINTSNILNINDNIKIIDGNGIENICKIEKKLNDNYYKINKTINTSNVLLYGTEIDDYHILDKDFIYTLNISATQQLYKKISLLEKKIEELEKKI